MGGLAGHMLHLYENPDFTFADLSEIFRLLSTGQLPNIQEKADGQNMFFTYNHPSRILKFARNKTQMRQNGLQIDGIKETWDRNPRISRAFVEAYQVLSKSLSSLSNNSIKNIFGENNSVWYSMEIIHPETENVIRYAKKVLIFHNSGITLGMSDELLPEANADKFSMLQRNITSLSLTASKMGWEIMGPVKINLPNSNNDLALVLANEHLKEEFISIGLTEESTISDYLAIKFSYIALHEIECLTVDDALGLGVAFTSFDFSPGARKKIALSINKSSLVAKLFLSKKQLELYKSLISPIENIIRDFSIEILSRVDSKIASSSKGEARRLRTGVEKIIEQIKDSNKKEQIAKVESELLALGDMKNISASLEGIVFGYKENTYKLTGIFLPLTRIFGLLRYS